MRSTIFFLSFIICTVSVLAQSPSMELLHATRGTHAGIYDEHGRYVLLRGANYNVLGEYWQGVPDVPATKEYDDRDIEMMAQNGFNCVRLLFTWSRLEPQRGQYDMAYINKIAHCIEVAAKYHMYVLIDMHQDAWGKYVATQDSERCREPAKGWDGAPKWATLTDGQPTCTRKGRESAPAVFRAFHNFWDDRDSLQEACVSAWSKLVYAIAKYPNVLGYDMLNEPNLGERTLYRENKLEGKYYMRLIRGIRAAEQASGSPPHIIFFEVSVTLHGRELPSVPLSTFRPEKNIVFSPHHYFESLTDLLTIEQGFGILRFTSFFYHTDMLIGEWGYFGGAGDTNKVKRFAKQEDKLMIGSTWWQWSQACGDPHSIGWNGHQWQAPDRSMHIIELDRQGHFTGRVNEPILTILNRTRPLAVYGRVRGFSSDPDTGDMQLKGHGKDQGTTTIWIPQRFGLPVINGENIISSKVDIVAGGYKAEVTVKGRYSISIARSK